MTAENPLSRFTEDELLAELVRRRNERQADEPPDKWCDDCRHFKIWERSIEPPDSYNPCQKRHVMQFFLPRDWDLDTFGYFRNVCSDRGDRLPEPPPPPPPRGTKPKAVKRKGVA